MVARDRDQLANREVGGVLQAMFDARGFESDKTVLSS
jgi:hypothetical protein